jgi:hypothetical protein
MNEKKPFNHEDYRIGNTDAFNLSKWVRENEPPPPGKYKVGDEITLVWPGQTITRVYLDCDGTTLYQLNQELNGFSDDCLLPGEVSADEFEELRTENARLREALAFYADEDTYPGWGSSHSVYLAGDYAGTKIHEDRGEKAREALAAQD